MKTNDISQTKRGTHPKVSTGEKSCVKENH
jgi:hypothetical protein